MRDQRRLARRFLAIKAIVMRRLVLPSELQSRNTPALARWLLGKVLVRTIDGSRIEGRITETEAYDSEKDLACHASKGCTLRTQVMYRSGGHWYVYLCYGVHEMLNLVTGPVGRPAAVLIRGLDTVNGPGRLTKRLKIDRALNAATAAPSSGLHLEDDGFKLPRGSIRVGPRIGVDYAGPIWAEKPWRFWVEEL